MSTGTEEERASHAGATGTALVGVASCCDSSGNEWPGQVQVWDRGEVTATTALIVILVIAAIATGGTIAIKIASCADNVPRPEAT